MLVSILLIFAVAIGGLAVTYLIVDDEPLMWRLAAGGVVGSAWTGTIRFVIASAFGLNTVTAAATILAGLTPITVFLNSTNRRQLERDWIRANGKLRGANLAKAYRF